MHIAIHMHMGTGVSTAFGFAQDVVESWHLTSGRRSPINAMTQAETPLIDLLDDTHGKPKLLVVDDQPINIQVMYQAFAGDCQVFMATSGEQALTICKSNPPDLVLLDVVMPGMDGFEVCKRLKADEATRNIPVIFVTAHTDSAQETHGLSIGAVDFIAKPINPAVVRARVKTHLTLKFQSDLLRKLVFLDGLSGVYNRRYFDQQLSIEWARSSRSAVPLSVLMIDVDYFKAFNDRYGHQAGDDCLRQIALTLKTSLKRPADLVARYGGEEFACILPDTAFDDAFTLARDMEARVRDLHIKHETSDAANKTASISIGLATRTIDSAGDAPALMGLADAQLYEAKQTGRARVCGKVL
jgi:diguanylate cyclase (GGDEF)-like protein